MWTWRRRANLARGLAGMENHMNTMTQNGHTQYVPLSQVDIPEGLREHSSEPQEELTQDMKVKGQLQEVILEALPNGHFGVIAGKGRTVAAKALGWNEIRAQVLTQVSPLDKELIRIAENEKREDFNPFDRALAYDRAVKAKGEDQRSL